MIDIEKIKDEIIECLLPLEPEKVILFGSYANGTATEDSDVDLFLVKRDGGASDSKYSVKAHLALRQLIRKYKIGFDTLSATQEFIDSRRDYFYRVDILQNGRVLYG